MADFNLGVALNADPSGFNNAMDNAAKKSADSFALIYDTAKQYLGMAGVAGTFAKAADAAGKFYQAVADIGAISGQPLENVDKLLLDIDSRISTALGSANTMYEVFSSGIDGTNKEIAELTEIIGKTANVIRADIVSTGDAMTTIMNAWGIAATDAKDIMDGLFITVREGKAHGDELARTFGLVTATASAMGTELDDLFAAVAILSRTQSSSQSMIGLNQMLNAIIKPTMEAKAAANKWGIELSASAIQTKGLSAVLTELHDKVGGNVEALEAMFGNIRAGRAILALTGEQFDEYIKVLDQMRGKSGSAEEAFKKQMNTMKAETERFKNEVTKAFITVGKDTEVVTTTLAKMGSAVLESFRASSSGIGDFYNDISAVMGLTSRFDESLSKDIKTLQRYTLYVMGALRFVKMLKDQFDKVTESLKELREDGTKPGRGGRGGKKDSKPSTRASKLDQDAISADALNAALQRVADTFRTQVNPSIRELGAAFRTVKRAAKAADTAVTDLAGKVNKATAAVGKLKAAIKETNTNLGATSKAITAIAAGFKRVSARVVGINTALTGTKSRLMDIRTSQTIITNGYKAHTAAINATNLALARQIALLKTAQAAMAGNVAGGPKAKRPTTKRGKASQPTQPATAPVVTAVTADAPMSSSVAVTVIQPPLPNPRIANSTPPTIPTSFFGNNSIIPYRPVAPFGESFPHTAPASQVKYLNAGSYGGGWSTGPIPDGARVVNPLKYLNAGSYGGGWSTGPIPDGARVVNPGMAQPPPLPNNRSGAGIDTTTAELKALRKEGIGIKNGDRLFSGFAKNVSGSLKDIFGGGINGVFNAIIVAQTASMAYQLGKLLDERFGVSDTISDDVTGFKAYTAQQKREAIGATAADISRFIGNDASRGSSAKLSTTEASSYLSRAMRANTPEEIGKIFGELKDLTAERETPQERQSRQRQQLEERLAEDIAKYEAIKKQVETSPSQVITASKMGAMTAYLAGERGKAPEALSGYIERDFSRAFGVEKGKGWFGSYSGLGNLTRQIPIFGQYQLAMGVKDALSDEKQKEEYNKAIDLVEAQVANTNDNPTAWRDFTLALAAGNLDKAGIAGQTKYTQEAVKAIVAAMVGKLSGETPTKEELDKHLADAKKVPVKTEAELINEGVVSAFENIDIAYTTKMLDMGMELAGSYTGFGRGDFANRAVEAAQANYDALAQALEDKQKEYDAAFAKHLSMGKTPEEARTQLAGNARSINTALAKLTEAENGIYGALDKKRAALEKKIQDDIAALIGVRSIVLRRPTTLNEEAGKTFLDAVYAGHVDNAEKKMDALIAAKNAASLDPSTENLNAVKIAQEESDAAEEAVLDANISRGEYAKAISGQKIAMLQMQMEGAGIDKGMGRFMGATELQDIQRTMLKGIEEEAKGMYERASKDLEENGQDSMFSPVEVEEFKLNMKRASAALIDFTKNLDNARDRTQQSVMAGVQSFTDMKDLRGDLNATALYHSINFMARLTPPERLLGSRVNPRAEVPEALNFKNATDAQAGVARALDAYVMSQQYRQAGLATTVENIYNTLRTGNTIVVR